ncbi:histidine acid phosphatase family protein [Entamoeba histolytica HM-1:IMSS-B]|uniref:Histidine acid phosphatase family protein n=5 Tax=Entamoeba histolytica TaxID=5759 RepID=C4MA90_ENTH1|nr:hypothetical protein EHI_039860 [Entamoeba histolytica HM-1:IMSS]EMH77195.1 histidine acid phosphatase family protein [Entamoeba histolytica HM-1:IMSS-B]EMS11585.1 histidine acid phosphatase superfamily protein [Entamoeba histolytica HM-3:IMSS]ENY62599.1 histidine acid phosphatase superfamily protein, putative [Entamoeba histolytica HM-1:IMSS-A]GAT98682.1 histidine acid phosphatase family protein [Entamoeba histolytica]EAL46577.2 hypothetical protein EHI_039860 [Entamoeba histolytica HM-1:I|eukprot:XP_651963.2 hypothetical protein EHI_039860 [Entamoeba histolytica HM-1:IMSS]
MFILVLFICLSYSQLCTPIRAQYKDVVNGYTLKYVQAIARHGDRAPGDSFYGDNGEFYCGTLEESHIYMNNGNKVSHTASSKATVIDKKNNPFAENYMWKGSCEPGQLTPEGITMHYQLGKHFDEIYRQHHQLLPTYFDPSIVKIRASAKVRTLQSAQAFLQTFYPLERRKSVVDIEIKTRPYEIETLKPNRNCCPKINELEEKIATNEDIIKRREEPTFKNVFNKLKRITGFQSGSSYLYDYVDLITARICHNVTLPCKDNECFTEDDYKILVNEYLYENKYFFNNEIAPYQLGFFIDEMLNDTDDALKSNIVYQHYSAHDTSIYGILSLLEYDTQIAIPYASTIVFEYYTKDNQIFVRTLLNDEVLKLNKLCTLIDDMCSLTEFESKLRAKVPQYSSCNDVAIKKPRIISRKGWFTNN